MNNSLWQRALAGVPEVSSQQWAHSNWLVRWLLAARASVLPLTVFAVVFAGALAQPRTLTQWLLLGVALLALVLAHATNNLINDYVDFRSGLDQDNYFRTQYGVHVLASGLLTPSQLVAYIAATGTAALVLGAGVCIFRGGESYMFAALGAFFVLFYTYPLKRMALGEVAVFLTWGPLMVGGVHLVVSGELSSSAVYAGMVYGLGPSAVIFAKHTDKAEHDRSRGVLSLPALLGDTAARYSIAGIVALQFSGAALVAFIYDLHGLLALLLACPSAYRLLSTITRPAPAQCPADYPSEAWPLWYTTQAFVYARDAGLWLTAGLLLQNILT